MKKWGWVIVCFALMTLGFLVEQAAVNWLPGAIALRAVCKGIASGSAALLCALGARITRTRRDGLLTVGLILCTVGDVLINMNNTLGMALFGCAHVLFCAAFLCVGKPTKHQWLGFGIAVAIGMVALYFLREKVGARLVPVMIYMLVLFFMGTLSIRQHMMLRWGAFVFILSDFLLAMNVVIGKTPLSQFISLAVYYVALGLISYSTWHAIRDKGAVQA